MVQVLFRGVQMHFMQILSKNVAFWLSGKAVSLMTLG